MSLREWINNNQPAAITGVVVVLVVSLGYAAVRIMGDSGYQPATHGYFYDVSTGELFVADNSEVPPIRDGNGVRAVVLSCGECSDASTHFIGWLETYTPEGKQQLLNPGGSGSEPADPNAMAEMAGGGGGATMMLAAAPDNGEPRWISAGSRQASELHTRANTQCPNNRRPTACTPGDTD